MPALKKGGPKGRPQWGPVPSNNSKKKKITTEKIKNKIERVQKKEKKILRLSLSFLFAPFRFSFRPALSLSVFQKKQKKTAKDNERSARVQTLLSLF